MNILTIWQSMRPMVKMTIVICITLVTIASMVYGYFGDILEVLK